jgi:hypothetical protein
MDYDSFKELVFSAIAAHDGKWSWYQLDRHLSEHNPEMTGQLMAALGELQDAGRIRSVPNITAPAQPHYTLGSGNGA